MTQKRRTEINEDQVVSVNAPKIASKIVSVNKYNKMAIESMKARMKRRKGGISGAKSWGRGGGGAQYFPCYWAVLLFFQVSPG